MTLQRYKQKRHFERTPEPAGGRADPAAPPIFVVQLHHASHRHYDFRLQVGGVLKSWAVPKGPSFDPSVRRLAMEVEDHPLDYASFEGVIPPGQYGAGDVRIFDHGTWSTDDDARAQLRRGRLHFRLSGDKLRGAWDLVRTGSDDGRPRWILRKSADDEAGAFEADDLLGDPDEYRPSGRVWHSDRATRRAPARKLDLPGEKAETIDAGYFAPQLCRLVEEAPRGGEWIHEPKWDGYRLLAAMALGKPRLWSRNAIDWTDRLPGIARAIAHLGAGALRLDGELIAVPKKGKRRARGRHADFDTLQATIAGEGDGELRYVVFDVLHVDGVDLTGCALGDRKRILQALVARRPDPALVVGEFHGGDPGPIFKKAVRDGHEGIVSKRLDAPYRPARGDDWRKLRAYAAEELAVVGWTDARGSKDGLGALVMARPAPDGGWTYAGRVGPGLDAATVRRLGRALRPIERATPPVTDASLALPRTTGELRHVHWVEPRLAVEVEHHGRGKHGLLRHPSLKAVREDKAARDLEPIGAHVTLTSGERVVYPERGITKAEVFAYYERVAPLMLAEIGRRPLAVVRCPDGASGTCFFQKHHGKAFGAPVGGAPIANADGTVERHLYVEDAAGLLQLVQMNVLELHPWGTHLDDVERADRVIFDLDPGVGVPWKRVVAAARLLRRTLQAIDLESFVRTSGKKGLHVVVPIEPTPWPDVKRFARDLAAALARSRPRELVDVAGTERRRGKIFIDYLRNSRGATSVASYSLRNHPEATVAWPLAWDQLGRVKGPRSFELRCALRLLEGRRRDPWARLPHLQQSLPRKAG